MSINKIMRIIANENDIKDIILADVWMMSVLCCARMKPAASFRPF